VTVSQAPRTSVDPHSHQSGGTTEPRRWVIDIPPGTILLNTNNRMHWAKQYRIKKNILEIAQQLATIQRIPHIERAIVTGLLHQPDRRRRDPHNWSLTYKEAVDGIVRAGVLTDDSSQYLTDGGIQDGEPAGRLSFSLLIEEAPAP
jgi:crossover junction endodeoxyribonuclease RusA